MQAVQVGSKPIEQSANYPNVSISNPTLSSSRGKKIYDSILYRVDEIESWSKYL